MGLWIGFAIRITTVFGTKTLKIPFDAMGKKWVRLAVWDAAGDGAWLQPVGVK